jgi:DNA-binding transcriptional LysR family regulator
MLRAALAGGGLTFATEENLRPFLESGELVPLLQDFLPPFPGFFLYFPQRRDMAPKMAALVEHVRRWRERPGAAPAAR